ncbi:MAG: hypothetical protein ACYTEX_22775 [Planctomycetota bacterium]
MTNDQGNLTALADRPDTVPRVPAKIGAHRLRQVLKRIRELKLEALRLAIPLPHAEPFHASRHQIRLLDGSNQSAKTFHELLEISRAVCGCDPYHKYPKTNGRAIIVGYGCEHLADPLFRKLFLPGEFKLVPDEHTGEMRAVRPDPADPHRLDPYDDAYREKWRDAPPLIPPRLCNPDRDIAWEAAGKQEPKLARIRQTGWQILFRTSGGRPPRGRQVHLVAFDEDLQYPDLWVNEIIPRLVKHGGRLIWAATPQEGGPELYELRLKADAGSSHVKAFTMLIKDNPFISDDQREFFRDTLTSEDEINVRIHGEYAIVGRRIYRTYDPTGIHGCEPFEVPVHEWTRYVILDPATDVGAILFGAVDPEERYAFVYDAVSLKHAEVQEWAAEVLRRQGAYKFEAGIIDEKAGVQRGMANVNNQNVAGQYFRALERAGVVFRRLGPLAGFFPGTGNIGVRENALLSWMAKRPDGQWVGLPILQVMRGLCPKLDRQIRLCQSDPKRSAGYPHKRVDQEEDLLVCLEYWAAFSPGHFAPELIDDTISPSAPTVRERFEAKRRKRRHRGEAQTAYGAALEIGHR